MSRLFFRGIYFPQKGVWSWLKLAIRNRRAIGRVVKDAFTLWHGAQGPAGSRHGVDDSLQPFSDGAEESAGAD